MTIIVCGAGTMGSGIAETAAKSGFETVLFDLAPTVLEKARSQIEKNLAAQVSKGKIGNDERNEIYGRIRFTHHLEHCKGDIVIEAIVERTEPKKDLFLALDKINTAETILATNTSSLSVTQIAEGIPHPERICGMHFFNPAQLMKLVEVVKGRHSAESVMERVRALARQMGKTPVTCADSPGFIVNRVARHFYLESLKLVEEGICDAEQADRILESAGFRMGPFRLMDLIGNDINLAVTRSLYEACGKPERFRPSPIQEDKVRRGELGRKTGKGYYSY